MVFVASAPGSALADDEFFEKQIRPILVERCQSCHGDQKPKGGLRLTSREMLLRGGDTGPAVLPGKPEESLLVQAVGYLDEPKMPPKQKLSDADVAKLTRWVALGASWPASNTTAQGDGGRRLSGDRGPEALVGLSAGPGPNSAGRQERLVASERDRPLHSGGARSARHAASQTG